MNPRERTFACVSTILLVFLGLRLLASPALAQQPKGELDKIFADWEKKRAAATTIKYVTRGEYVVANWALAALPPPDFRYTKNATWVIWTFVSFPARSNRWRSQAVGWA
jgi:hypothetical protein